MGITELMSSLQILGFEPEKNVIIEDIKVSVLCGNVAFLFKSSGGPIKKSVKEKIVKLSAKGYQVETISRKEISGIVKLSACQYGMHDENSKSSFF